MAWARASLLSNLISSKVGQLQRPSSHLAPKGWLGNAGSQWRAPGTSRIERAVADALVQGLWTEGIRNNQLQIQRLTQPSPASSPSSAFAHQYKRSP
jgi:hypothetical protein